jgi:hypothetical protein
MGSVIGSILGILVCGGIGGVGAWALVTTVGLSGTVGAIVAAVIGMVISVALWAGGWALLRALGWVR